MKRPDFGICKTCDEHEYDQMLEIRKWVVKNINKKAIFEASFSGLAALKSSLWQKWYEQKEKQNETGWTMSAVYPYSYEMFGLDEYREYYNGSLIIK